MSSATTSEPALPGRLREARANDTAILAAAREVFAQRGRTASVADIAAHACVGVGSIYRRYPTKEALVEALHVHGVRAAVAIAEDVAESVPTPSAVGTFLARHIAEVEGPLLQPSAAHAEPLPEALAAASEALGIALDRLIALDRDAAVIPAGLTAADVMQLMLHLRPHLPLPRDAATALHTRYLAMVMAGLRAEAERGADLEPGPRWDEWVGAWHE